MGHWGVKSYENDDADFALDAGFDRVHGAAYEALMDDRNPLSFEQIQQRLANAETLAAAVSALEDDHGPLGDSWDESARLAYCGVVARHAELGVKTAREILELAIRWLHEEDIDWQEATLRRLRRDKEIARLTKALAESETR